MNRKLYYICNFFCIFGRDESKRSLSCCTVFLDLLAFKNVLKDCLHMPTRRSCCRSFPLLSSRECLPVHDCYYHHHYHHDCNSGHPLISWTTLLSLEGNGGFLVNEISELFYGKYLASFWVFVFSFRITTS